MGYAKYLEDIIDRLVEDLSEGVPPDHLKRALSKADWPKATKGVSPEERLSEADQATHVLREFLTYVIHKMRDQQAEIKTLRHELSLQRQQYALAAKRHANARDSKEKLIEKLRQKLR